MSLPAIPPPDDVAMGVSLDALFRNNAKSRPNELALIDPRDRTYFTDFEPRKLTYAKADAMVEQLAHRVRSFGLRWGSVVAVQLPNVVEATLMLLAIMRAGMVAAPVPMPWRRSDLVAALSEVQPRAFVTLARFVDERPAHVMCEAAADLFQLSFPCAFGAEVPDGVIALDEALSDADARGAKVSAPPGDHIAIATFDATAGGFFPAARGHAQWLAAGLSLLLEAKIESGDTILTTLPPNSLAGIGAAIVPWLLSGGALEFAGGASTGATSSNDWRGRTHLIAPAPVIGAFAKQHRGPLASCVAVHRARHGFVQSFASVPCELMVDLFTFGELGMVAMGRDDRSKPNSIPLGPIAAPSSGGAPVVIETELAGGELLLRGPMLPRGSLPSGASGGVRLDAHGFTRTGFRCHTDGNGRLVIDSGPSGVATVGGLRFGLDDLASRIARCVPEAMVHAIGDTILGERIRVEVDDPVTAAAALHADGHSRHVVEAVVQAVGERRAVGQ
jgi:non-ribosomal peptide synthetase component E (peptide arylation enzyme)